MPLEDPAADLYYYFHTDHLGTPYVLTNSSKQVTWKISLDPFGETVTEQNGNDNNFRFPGQYLDRESDLNYNWHRYYQPKVGRYYQTDPYWGFRFTEKYNYAENNPTLYIDPFGLFGTKDFVWHYFFGKGVAIDLGNVGLLHDFRNAASVQKATSGFEASIFASAKLRAGTLCENCGAGNKSTRFSISNRAESNVTNEPGLFSVGKSTFFRVARCDLTADCSANYYYYFCSLRYSIKDWFRDPINLGGELRGGTPYPINASWTGFTGGMGDF